MTFETFDQSDEETWPTNLPTYIPIYLPTFLHIPPKSASRDQMLYNREGVNWAQTMLTQSLSCWRISYALWVNFSVWYHVDLVITPTVPRSSGNNRANCLGLACVSGRGHPHRPQPHQDIPGPQGEFYVKKRLIYDKLWASVMKAVPKLDESESGQMVLK